MDRTDCTKSRGGKEARLAPEGKGKLSESGGHDPPAAFLVASESGCFCFGGVFGESGNYVLGYENMHSASGLSRWPVAGAVGQWPVGGDCRVLTERSRGGGTCGFSLILWCFRVSRSTSRRLTQRARAHQEPRPAPSQYTGHSVGQRGATSGTLLVVVMVAALTILDADVLMWWTEAERTMRRTNSSSRASSSVGVRWGLGLGEPVQTEAADEAGVLLGVRGV